MRYSDFKDQIQILLILKDRPEWQKGKLNLPGGRMEEGETPEEAAKRELHEETGLQAWRMQQMGVMKDRQFTIHCLNAIAETHVELKPREGETEEVMWMPFHEALADKRLIPNLRVIIPLMRCEVDGWTITDSACPEYKPLHTISVTIPTFSKPPS
jgi:8-oxo-dGTP pyrophosphatase MutT (NUDIX family)